jgi:LysM repeat protein
MLKINTINIVFFFLLISLSAYNQSTEYYIVSNGDNLYRIAKKHNLTISELKKLNKLKSDEVELGKKLIVGKGNISVNEVSKDKKADKEPIAEKKIIKQKYHIAKKGETLFSICSLYKVDKSEFISINKLKGKEIKIGSKYIIPTPTKEIIVEKKETPMLDFIAEKDPKVIIADDRTKKYKEVTDNCIVEWVDDESFISNKSIAMHSSAPPGTVIQLTNIMNGRTAQVKVISNLPKAMEVDAPQLKITRTIADRLGVIDKQFRCSIKYTVDASPNK